jgi:hypothetical protein
MSADPRRRDHRGDYDRVRRARTHQEEALDEALKNIFPASDPNSIMISEQNATTEAAPSNRSE